MDYLEQIRTVPRKMRDKIGEVYFVWKEGDAPLNGRFKSMMEEKYGVPVEPWDDPKWIQCSSCNRWFKNTVRLEMSNT